MQSSEKNNVNTGLKRMEQTWRWFGPQDPVSLQHVRQAGATGIVTALHHISHGEVWPEEEILKRKKEIEDNGLSWSVVESVTVHESIKTRTGNYQEYIEKYKTTLQNLAKCGINIVTYNFMPVLDWTRTSINYEMPNGAKALYFNWLDLIVFDVHILQRKDAANDYDDELLAKSSARFKNMTTEEIERLTSVVLLGIPGEEEMTLELLRKSLTAYEHIGQAELRENLKYFLQEVSPIAQKCGVKLAIHPDDPPFDILGLPRVVNSREDFEFILHEVNIPANGICFCTGSLGASSQNNLPELVKYIADRIHFVHLRNVSKDQEGNFYEADHLGGDVNMFKVMKELLIIQQKVQDSIPFRSDHGHQMLDDLHKVTNPGYSAIGRLKGLAELRGLELGVVSAM
ncbi:mannonate dehydratase [Solitalea koreensis]|uniref:Mannonate dehydratase n=1 Tax=Solitalea koreensis TaxID=543615 RepID=A0A521CKX6_9SPHI|nr:mannonate dehydratase [Solitalea koreensis]SMO60078.1 mannonate dehydratase [Solitalea koreensis]